MAFPFSDYYGTADCLLLSSLCKVPAAGSQTFLHPYPFMKPLGRHLMPGESIHALNHSSRMNPVIISYHRVNREKPALFTFSEFPAFTGP
jgi:hypothetical protein